MRGLSTSGSISIGCALVAGRNGLPSPPAGNTALRTLEAITLSMPSGGRCWQPTEGLYPSLYSHPVAVGLDKTAGPCRGPVHARRIPGFVGVSYVSLAQTPTPVPRQAAYTA